MTTIRHRAFISVAVVATALSVLTGCTRSVGGNAELEISRMRARLDRVNATIRESDGVLDA
jgi:hypothetical protein